VSDNVLGTQGELTLGTGAWGLGKITPRELRSKGYPSVNPYQKEHDDLAASVRGEGPHVFEGDYGADASMTAVLGRMATYSGRVVTWEEAVRSEVRLAPARYAFDAEPPSMPGPDGNYPVARPGVTKAG
jgi:hypothetical protein